MKSRGSLIVFILMAAVAVGLSISWLQGTSENPPTPVAETPKPTTTASSQSPDRSATSTSVADTALPGDASSPDPQRPLQLTGRVVRVDQTPVTGAVVTLGPTPKRTTTTQQDGSFAFDGLPARTYSLTARKDNLSGGPFRHALTDSSTPVEIQVRMGSVVKVTVVDKVKDIPVASAVVTIITADGDATQRVQGISGKNGVATLYGVAAGDAIAEASAEDYTPARMDVHIPSNAPASFQLSISSGVLVSGFVLDEGGLPIAGARVTVQPNTFRGIPVDPNASGVLSEVNGAYSHPAVAPGSYRLLAVHPGYQATRSELFEVVGAPMADMDVVMRAGARVHGRVVDTNNKPVGGATVRAQPEELNPYDTLLAHRMATTTSAPDGSFELTGLGSGRILVTSANDAASSEPETVEPGSQSSDPLILVLNIVDAISGTVVNGDDLEVAGARVTAYPVNTKAKRTPSANLGISRFRSATTGADGTFAIRGLSPGTYMLVAARASNAQQPLMTKLDGPRAHTGDTGVTLVLENDGGVGGKVVFESGEPLKAFKVQVGIVAESKVNSNDGTFEISAVTPGTHNLLISGVQFSALAVRDVVVNPDQITDIGTITVQKGRSVSGRVYDSSGNTVAGATVVCGAHIFSDGKSLVPPSPAAPPQFKLRTTKSDSNGEYVITGLPMTSQMVASEHSEAGRSDIIPIPEGDSSAQIDIHLYGFGSLTGRVTKSGKPVSGLAVIATGSGGVSAAATTGKDGIYLFERLPSDNFEVKATLLGQSSGPEATGSVEVEPQIRAKLDLELEAGDLNLDISIASQDGSPITLAKVTVFEGIVEAGTIKELEALKAGRDDPETVHSTQALGAVAGAQLQASLRGLNPGPHTACVTPISGDLADEAFMQRLAGHRDNLRTYCESTALAETPTTQTMAMSVPPMAPLP